jgi:hypothetical protein
VGRLVRRFGAGQRHHPRRGFRCNRRFAGLAGLVAEQTLNPALLRCNMRTAVSAAVSKYSLTISWR